MTMDIQNCAELVQRGDPDRFRSAMTAKPELRAALFVLYAFNLEVARAPWVTKEAMIAEMRLQWWMDAIEEIYAGDDVRRHEVVTPLSDLIKLHDLPRDLFEKMIDARRWDIYQEAHKDEAAFETYIRSTSSNLYCLTSLATGARIQDQDAVSDFGYAAGLANLFVAIPKLENMQKRPLIDGRDGAVQGLAQYGLTILDASASKLSGLPKSANAAMRSGWKARFVLKQAADAPGLVAVGALGASEFRSKLRLMKLAAFNRF